MHLRIALLALPLALLSGCSLFYDIGQQRALESCDRAASAQDRTACRKANGKSYDDYEAQRKRLKEGQPG